MKSIVLIAFLVTTAVALPAFQTPKSGKKLAFQFPNIVAKNLDSGKKQNEATWELLLEKHNEFRGHVDNMLNVIKAIAEKEVEYGPSILRGIQKSTPLFSELFDVVEEYINEEGFTKDIFNEYTFELNTVLVDNIANACFVLIEYGEESVSNELNSVFLPGYTRIAELLLEIEEIVIQLPIYLTK